MNDDDHKFVVDCLAAQHRGESLADKHDRLLWLLDRGFVGMMGFKYCWPEAAREDFRRWHVESERKAS